MDKSVEAPEPLLKSRRRLGLWPPYKRRLHRLDALRQFREDLKEARALFEQNEDDGHTRALFAAYYFLEVLDPYDHDGLHQLFRGLANQRANDRKGLPLQDLGLMARLQQPCKL